MSHVGSEQVRCPACGYVEEADLFHSLNGERMPDQMARILDGTFEQRSCSACERSYRPEHRMLLSHFSLRIWVVMYPPERRPEYPTLEKGVAEIFAREFAAAPNIVRGGLRGARPRLVFGQHFLAETLRVSEADIDATLLECLKLLCYRAYLERLMPLGPIELCLEGFFPSGELELGVYRLGAPERLDTLPVPATMLSVNAASREAMEARYPALFAPLPTQTYFSATRCLFPSPHEATPPPTETGPLDLY